MGGFPLSCLLTQSNPTSIQQASALVSPSNSHTHLPQPFPCPTHVRHREQTGDPLSAQAQPPSAAAPPSPAPLTPCFSDPGSGHTDQGSQVGTEEALPG